MSIPDVILVTGTDMPDAETETAAVHSALLDRGLDARVEQWDSNPVEAGLIVVHSTWDYTARLEDFLAWVRRAAAQSTLLNPASVIEWNSHKGYLVQLADAGVATVPTTMVARGTTDAEIRELLAPLGSDLVVKPAVDAGARGARRSSGDVPGAVEHASELARRGDVLVQPFLPEISNGEVSLIVIDGELSHAVRKSPAAADWRVQKHLGGRTEPTDPTPAEVALAVASLAAAPGPTAYARVDMVAVAGAPLLMELELIEPHLFLTEAAGALDSYVDALVGHLAAARPSRAMRGTP